MSSTKHKRASASQVLAAVSMAASIGKLVCDIITALAGIADLVAHCSVYGNYVMAVLNSVSAVIEVVELWRKRKQTLNE